MRVLYSTILILGFIYPLFGFSQPSINIEAPNNSGIITQGQNGNNYIYQKSEELSKSIYQDGKVIGDFEGIENKTDKNVSLLFAHIEGSLHPWNPIEVQGMKLYCPLMVKMTRYPSRQAAHYSFTVGAVDVCDIVER